MTPKTNQLTCLTCQQEYRRAKWQARNRTRECNACRATRRQTVRDAKHGTRDASPKCTLGRVRWIFDWRP